MKQTNTEKLGDVLKAYLQNTRLGQQMGEQEALNVWPQITGPAGKHTMELKVYNSIIYAKLNSSAARDCLQSNKQQLQEEQEKRKRKETIKDIVLR